VKISLVRYAYLPHATLGFLMAPDLRRLATIEEPWHENPNGPGGSRLEFERVASCVPDGVYRLIPHDSAKHGAVWALVNPEVGVWHQPRDVPQRRAWGRDAVLIHVANSTADIEGCIGVGLRADRLTPGVYQSRAAVDALRAKLGREEHELTIRPCAGTSESLHLEAMT
jgi:hypothetical protein